MSRKYLVTISFVMYIFISYPGFLMAQSGNNEISPIGQEGFAVMRQFFEYDKPVPLKANIGERIDKPGYVREKISFIGPDDTSVPGYFAIPKHKNAPYPCVLLIHGLTGSKEGWWEENSAMGQLTMQLLEAGFSVLSLDAKYHGERSLPEELKNPLDILEKGWFIHSRDMMVQSVIEYRRGMDYLATRPEIDTSRIGVVGYSMGGIITFILSAVDPRIQTSVACVSPIINVPYLPTAIYNYAPHINNAFLMLMGNNDERNYTRETAGKVYELINSNQKDMVFFESGHMLPAEWTTQAAKWTEKYLK